MVPKTENAAIKFEQENAAKLTAASGLMSLLGDYGSDSDDESWIFLNQLNSIKMTIFLVPIFQIFEMNNLIIVIKKNITMHFL